MLCGILNVNKPSGVTSRDVVNRAERLTRPARCGHAGTLDPLAAGVLVICVGAATRLVQYVQRMPKCYRATFLLGCQSPTDDVDGEVARLVGARRPSRSEVDVALPAFVGEIMQRPPAHSAVKVSGRRAYALARQGKPVELAPRRVIVHSLALRRYEYPELGLEIECGSGTYARSLGRDVAEALGTAAVMSALVRTAIGGFCVEEAVRPDELTADSIHHHLLPALTALPEMPRVAVNEAELERLRHGQPIAAQQTVQNPAGCAPNEPIELAAIDLSGRLTAIVVEKRPAELWPVLNLV